MYSTRALFRKYWLRSTDEYVKKIIKRKSTVKFRKLYIKTLPLKALSIFLLSLLLAIVPVYRQENQVVAL